MGFWGKIFGSSKREITSATKSVPVQPVQSKTTPTAITQTPGPRPGSDCAFYAEEICRVGGSGYLCSLGAGNYWSDCHVYPTTGLKGKYDKEKGEAARRRALSKRCNRCKVPLQVPENVDFRYSIGEFASEREFKVTSEAAGVSRSICHADFCHKCMGTLGKRHPISGGLACLDCGGHMTKFNP